MGGAQDKHRIAAHHEGVSDVPPESRPASSAEPPETEPDPHSTRVLPPDRPAPAARERFVDRLWSFRALIAVALASVILGGLAGAALANIGDEDERRGPGRFHRMGPMGPPGHQQWQWRGPRDDQMPRWQVPPPGGPGQPTPSPPTPTPSG